MKELEFLKKHINKNPKIKKILEKCNDDFLMKNKSIILAALDSSPVEGYKIHLEVQEDSIAWRYEPNSEETINIEKKKLISSKYLEKLPNGWDDFYLLDLNTSIKWTKDKTRIAKECKTIINNVQKNIIKNQGFWLWGKNDTGKTYLSIALLNSIASKGKTVAFVNVPDLILTLKKQMRDEYSNFSFEKIWEADFLLIDDIGNERITQWFKESVLLPLIDYRANTNKTTIFNSNYKLSKYELKVVESSSNLEGESEINNKIISRIRRVVGNKEIEIG